MHVHAYLSASVLTYSPPHVPGPTHKCCVLILAAQWAELKLGSGPVPREGQRVTIDYMMTRRGGAKIYSTFDSKTPFTWTLGDGTVIAALEQAVAGGEGVPPLLPGGARRVMVPQERGYGSRQRGWTTSVRTLGPVPPDFDWADSKGDLVNANTRFQDIYLNPNRIDQPDLIIDVKLVKVSDVEQAGARSNEQPSEDAPSTEGARQLAL